MLREIRLFDAQTLLDGARGKFFIPKDFEDGDTGWMGERLKDAGLISLERALQYIIIFEISNIDKAVAKWP